MSNAQDPLAPLGALPGVAEAVESVRKATDRLYGHRVMRRRSSEVSAEAALRGAAAPPRWTAPTGGSKRCGGAATSGPRARPVRSARRSG